MCQRKKGKTISSTISYYKTTQEKMEQSKQFKDLTRADLTIVGKSSEHSTNIDCSLDVGRRKFDGC